MILPQLLISMLLFFVLFFGIGFLLNMLLRKTWLMSFIYPLVVIFIVDDARMIDYVTKTGATLNQLGANLVSLTPPDVFILTTGLVGAIASGFVIRSLRANGYQMF